jgi:hypothetical protein
VIAGAHVYGGHATRHCITVRRVIADGYRLLFGDRDFQPFVTHLGLRSALDVPGVN